MFDIDSKVKVTEKVKHTMSNMAYYCAGIIDRTM
jgi:hypothetical protein